MSCKLLHAFFFSVCLATWVGHSLAKTASKYNFLDNEVRQSLELNNGVRRSFSEDKQEEAVADKVKNALTALSKKLSSSHEEKQGTTTLQESTAFLEKRVVAARYDNRWKPPICQTHGKCGYHSYCVDCEKYCSLATVAEDIENTLYTRKCQCICRAHCLGDNATLEAAEQSVPPAKQIGRAANAREYYTHPEYCRCPQPAGTFDVPGVCVGVEPCFEVNNKAGTKVKVNACIVHKREKTRLANGTIIKGKAKPIGGECPPISGFSGVKKRCPK